MGDRSLCMYTYVYRNEDHGTGQVSVSHPALPGSSPDVGEAMVAWSLPYVPPTYWCVYQRMLPLWTLYYACVPCTMLVDLILCLWTLSYACVRCALYFACGPLFYACGKYKAAEDAITKFKAEAASEASGHADASINIVTQFLDKMLFFVGEVSKTSDAEMQEARKRMLEELNVDVAMVFAKFKNLNFEDEQKFREVMAKEGAKPWVSLQAKLEKHMKKAETLYFREKFESAAPAEYIAGIPKWKFGRTP